MYPTPQKPVCTTNDDRTVPFTAKKKSERFKCKTNIIAIIKFSKPGETRVAKKREDSKRPTNFAPESRLDAFSALC
jgi:hypothetical protein